jgi:outer membrane protein OmpA-like peptidoglycan-associated protein
MGESQSNRPSWFNLIVISSNALLLGMLTGYLMAGAGRGSEKATAELAKALSKPLNLQVSITNSAPPLQVGKLLGSLADAAVTAIRTAESPVLDKAKLASVAANEFVKELSGGVAHEAGTKLVDGFSELISSGFKTSADKAKDVQVVTTFFVTNTFPVAGPSFVAPPPSRRKEARIVFEIGQAGLRTSANTTIGSIRDFAAANPSTIILLRANADTLGSERGNRDLAGRRSRVVRERLLSAGGIAANRIFVADLGNASLPIVTSTNTAEQQNRSVTIEVRE